MRRPAAALSIALALMLGGAAALSCKVINEDHCANKELPGNDWCSALSRSTPYCSPCIATFHGCVAFEPFACGGYDPVIMGGDPDEDDDGSSGGSDTSGAPLDTGGSVGGSSSSGP